MLSTKDQTLKPSGKMIKLIRVWMSNLLLFLVSFTVSVLGIEFYLHLKPFPRDMARPEYCEKVLSSSEDIYNFSISNAHYPPNIKVPLCSFEFNYSNKVDDNGYVGLIAGDRINKVLVFGDSFAYGHGVEKSKTFSAIVGGYNAGLSGTTFPTHARVFERIVPLLKPQIALWIVYPPHIISATPLGWRSKNQIKQDDHPYLHKLIDIYNKTSISRAIQATIGFSVNSSDYMTAEYSLYNDLDDREELGYLVFSDSVKNIAQMAKKYNVRVVPVIIPSKLQLNLNLAKHTKPLVISSSTDYDPRLPIWKIRDLLKIDGIDENSSIVLYDHLIKIKSNPVMQYYFNSDAHFNEDGNLYVANVLCESALSIFMKCPIGSNESPRNQ